MHKIVFFDFNNMDINNLKTNELTYELELRNIDGAAQMTVDEKRKLLRGCLKQESAHRSFVEPANNKPFGIDIKGAYETYNDLNKLLTTFSGTANEKNKFEDRLTHLSNRVSKLLPSDEQQMADKQTLMTKIIALEGELEFKLDQFKSNINTSTPTRTSPTVNILSPQTRNAIPPYKWNVSFTGSTGKESVISFLEKIEELRVSRNVSKEDLFLSAIDIFKGPAWTWFSTNRHNFNNWDEVVQKLKSDFLPYFYEQDLLTEIQNRTMGNNERVTLYISSMECLFRRLAILPDEKTRVDQIRRNLLPFYINQLALIEIDNICHLSTLCKKLEESRSWSDRYKTPPTRKFGLLEPDLSTFPSTSTQNTHFNSNTSTLRSFLTCWNCDRSGHRYFDCRSQKKIFCYGCGRKDTVKTKCISCSKNLDVGGGHHQVDAVTNTVETPPSTSKDKSNKKNLKNKNRQ